MRQLTGTEAGTLSNLLSYGTYVLDFRLNGTLWAVPECRQFKCMELTKTLSNKDLLLISSREPYSILGFEK